jgi:hypothetical protein
MALESIFIITFAGQFGETMNKLLEKLNYKGNNRIAVLNAEDTFYAAMATELETVTTDRKIDPRFPYGFIIIFVRNQAEVETFSPIALHNLQCDGVLWFCYPKKTSKKFSADIDRDHGWKTLNDAGFHGIRLVSVDNDWSALRFRNIKFIKTTSDRFRK